MTHQDNNNLQAARRAYQDLVQFARANGVLPEQAAWMQREFDEHLRRAEAGENERAGMF